MPRHPHEWGKINNGYPFGVTVFDVDRAIAAAGLVGVEQRLMQYLREYCWGAATRRKKAAGCWPDAVPVPLPLATLAEEWGIVVQVLSRAKQHLIRSRMIQSDDDGATWQPNKNAPEWVKWEDGSTPLLTSRDLEYACKGRRGKDLQEVSNSANGQLADLITEVSNSANGGKQICLPPVSASANDRLADLITPHNKERAAEDLRRLNTDPTGLDACGDSRTPASDDAEYSDPVPQFREEADATDITKAIGMLGSRLETESLASWVGRHHLLPECIVFEGWRFVEAAHVLLSPRADHDERQSWRFLMACVRNAHYAGEAEARSKPKKRPETNAQRKDREYVEKANRMKKLLDSLPD